MSNSTRPSRAKQPKRDFPLFKHQRGYWCKKVRGKLHYFGKIAGDPKGEAAVRKWAEQKDDLLAGRTPRGTPDGLTVADLCNHFMTAKEQQCDAGDITGRTFAEYFAYCKFLVDSLGRNRLVDDLAADDFQSLRAKLAKLYGVQRLATQVQKTRTIFKYGYEVGLIDKPMRFGPMFKRPPARIMRAHRQKNGQRMFEAAELQEIIAAADQPLKAMILLGINCGFGNADCGKLPKDAMDLDRGWVDFPRPKTAIERRCPLWPETVEAIREALAQQPKPLEREHDDLVFITRYGGTWSKATADNPVTKVFRILLDSLKLHRKGLGFYCLRHTFETIAGESRDQVAVNHIMGHADASMSAVYRERISDERLGDVVNHVHDWLFPQMEGHK
jgi:integrase